MSNLKRLRDLQFVGQKVDFGSIATLPQLEYLRFSYVKEEEILIFTRYLEDKEKFPALKYLVTHTRGRREDIYKEMECVLLDWKILLWD